MRLPCISVLAPVRNEARYIRGMLESVLANDLPAERYEILVVDGMSDDGTREIVREMAADHPNLRLIDNPDATVPFAMNAGIRAARGDVIVRVDGHAEVAPDFLRALLEELAAHPEAACVGGVIDNVHENEVAEAVALAMASPVGVGDARYRLADREGYVDTLLFGAYRRAAFDAIGLFDEALTRNQDDELNFRLVRSGRRIWMTPRIRSRYYVRGSYRGLWRQYFQYGYWKVYVNRKHRTVTSWRQLAPIALVLFLLLAGVVGLFAPPVRATFLAGIGAYLVATGAEALRIGRTPARAARTALAFWTMHLGYGCGYLEGVVDFLAFRREPRASNARMSR